MAERQDNLQNRLFDFYDKIEAGEDVSGDQILTPEEARGLAGIDYGIQAPATEEKYTVTAFESDPEVQEEYEKLMEYLAENQGTASKLLDPATDHDSKDIPEAMRDMSYRLTPLLTWQSVLEDAPEDIKNSMRVLQSRWEEAGVSGGAEFAKATWDIGTDIIANYENIGLFASWVFGTPAVGAANTGKQIAVRTGAKAALKRTLGRVKATTAANPVKTAGAYVGAITGAHDLATQHLDIDLDKQDDVSWGRVAGMTAFGGTLGAGLGWAVPKVVAKYKSSKAARDFDTNARADDAPVQFSDSKAVALYEEALEGDVLPRESGVALARGFDEAAERVNSSRNPRWWDDLDEDDVIDAEFDEIIDDFVTDLGGGQNTKDQVRSIWVGSMSSGGTGEEIKNQFLFGTLKLATNLTANFFGKSAGLLTPYTKYSKTADTLRKRLAHEFSSTWGKQTDKIGHDFAEVATRITGEFNNRYSEIIAPLAKNELRGELADTINATLNRAIRDRKPTGNGDIDQAAHQIRALFHDMGEELLAAGVIKTRVQNYIPRMWNRNAIQADKHGFAELLVKEKQAKDMDSALKVVDDMLDIENQLSGGTAGHFFSAKRSFDKITDDGVFSDFLEHDLTSVLQSYNFQVGKSLAKKKVLGVVNEREFISKWINPIVAEMRKAGKVLNEAERKDILKLYQSTTGEGMQRYGAAGQMVADGYGLVNRLAYLPLATVSSLTEIMINLGKAGPTNSIKGFAQASELAFKSITGDLHTKLRTNHNLTASEAWKELRSMGIAMTQAQSQIGNRLAGDDLMHTGMQNVSNKFFKMNLLEDWTRYVQMTSYFAGRNLIKENLETIARHGDAVHTRAIKTRIGELNELGVNYKEGVQWVLKGGKESDRFNQEVVSGAARYTNTVILQPTAMSNIKPLLHTNPKTGVLFQLMGYPTAFTNTVLKGAAKALTADPVRNFKLVPTALLMTETARWINYSRTWGKSEDNKTPWEARAAGLARWGGNGIGLDVVQRAHKGSKYTQSYLPYLGAPFGPIGGDIMGLATGRPLETLSKKVPLYSAGKLFLGADGFLVMKEYQDYFRGLDRDLKDTLIPENPGSLSTEMMKFNKGGDVEIPNAPAEPDERVDKVTGRPYNEQAGSAFMDSLDPAKATRLGFVSGGVAALSSKLARVIFKQTDEIFDSTKVNEVANKINKTIDDQQLDSMLDDYDPALADMGGDFADVIDEADLERYVELSASVHLREKNHPIPDNLRKEFSDPKTGVLQGGEEFSKARGYTKAEWDEFEESMELARTVDPDQGIDYTIQSILGPLKAQYDNAIRQDYKDKALDLPEDLDSLVGYYAAKILRYSRNGDKLYPNITQKGADKVARQQLAYLMGEGTEQEFKAMKTIARNLPDSTEPAGTLYKAALNGNIDQLQKEYVKDSVVKHVVYRGVYRYLNTDYQIGFAAPREGGVHYGSQGQANFILAMELNPQRAIDELSLVGTQGEKITQKQMNDFLTEELEHVNKFEAGITAGDPELLAMRKSDQKSMPPLSMVAGYINVKNPLDMGADLYGGWDVGNIVNAHRGQLEDSLIRGLGLEDLPAEVSNKLDDFGDMVRHIEEDERFLNTFSDISYRISSETQMAGITKDFQAYLKSLGFDSIRYKNGVEPSFKGESDDSFILFDPEQFKTITAHEFNPKDARDRRDEGGEVTVEEDKVESPEAKSPDFDAGKIYVTMFNAEALSKDTGFDTIEEATEYYDTKADIETTPEVNAAAEAAATSGAFTKEQTKTGVTPEQVRNMLVEFSKRETSGGNLERSKRVSPTGATGLWQIMNSSARAAMDQGQFGEKAAEATGQDLEKLKGLEDKELKKLLLKDDKLNAMFAAALIFQKLENAKNKGTWPYKQDEPREEKSHGGEAREGYSIGSVIATGAGKAIKAVSKKSESGFYSPLENAALKLKDEKSTAQNYYNKLKNAASDSELEWSGMKDFLTADPKAKVTRGDVIALAKANRITTTEKVGEAPREMTFEDAVDQLQAELKVKDIEELPEALAKDSMPDAYAAWKAGTLSPNDASSFEHEMSNLIYREADILIDDAIGRTIVPKTADFEAMYYDWSLLGPNANYREILINLPENHPLLGDVAYTPQHYQPVSGADKTVATVRMTSKKGGDNKVGAVIEEIQSDWNADLAKVFKEDGGKNVLRRGERVIKDLEPIDSLMTKEKKAWLDEQYSEDELNDLAVGTGRYGKIFKRSLDSDQVALFDVKRMVSVMEDVNANRSITKHDEVLFEALDTLLPVAEHWNRSKPLPLQDNPFREASDKLGLRRALTEAAREDADFVSLTTADVQSIRYAENGVKPEPFTEDEIAGMRKRAIAYDEADVNSDDFIDPNYSDGEAWIDEAIDIREQEIEDFEARHRGMEHFYDNVYLNFFKKFGKKYGKKIELREYIDKKGEAVELPSLELTPEMKKDILEGGLPQLNSGGLISKGNDPDLDGDQLDEELKKAFWEKFNQNS